MLVLVLAFFVGGGWLYAGQIRDGALASKAPATPALQSQVLAVGDHSITLAEGADLARHLGAALAGRLRAAGRDPGARARPGRAGVHPPGGDAATGG